MKLPLFPVPAASAAKISARSGISGAAGASTTKPPAFRRFRSTELRRSAPTTTCRPLVVIAPLKLALASFQAARPDWRACSPERAQSTTCATRPTPTGPQVGNRVQGGACCVPAGGKEQNRLSLPFNAASSGLGHTVAWEGISRKHESRAHRVQGTAPRISASFKMVAKTAAVLKHASREFMPRPA